MLIGCYKAQTHAFDTLLSPFCLPSTFQWHEKPHAAPDNLIGSSFQVQISLVAGLFPVN